MTDVILIGAGAEHSLAVRTDGSVWSWGRNNKGQLGQSTNGVSNTYKDMQTPDRVDRKSTRLNSSHLKLSRMPSSA